MKILLFKLGLLGDVIMTTPLVRQLRHIYPEAEIQYWVGNSYRVALERNPHLSSLVGFDEQMFFRRDMRAVYRLWRQLKKEQFMLAFLLGKHWIFNALAASLLIPRRIGFVREPISRLFLTDFVRFRDLRHEVHYYLDLLQYVGTPDYSDVKMEVNISLADEERSQAVIKRLHWDQFVGVVNSGGNNIGENQFARRLPSGFFEQLVSGLSKNSAVVLLGNNADREYYGGFSFPENVANLAGRLSFGESLAVMRRARRIFTTDCGGMHMAGAVNEHMTAFFGPAHPERKAPFLSDIEIVWPDRDRYSPSYDLFNTQPDIPSFEKVSYSLAGEQIGSALLSGIANV